MTFPVVGSNIPGAYQISNSLRFNDNDSAYLSRTPGSAGNRRTFTLSVWFKLTVNPAGDSNYERQILSADDGTGGNNNFDYIAINNSNKIFIYGYEGAENQQLLSSQVLRDASAWYHLVVAFDTTQATASNRIKVYLNGSQITDWTTANYPSLNFQTRFNNTNPNYIGKYPDSNTQYFDGYMAEYHLIDGQQLDASSFGEFDLDSGVWKPKQYAGTYGTNGFYLKFNNTGNMGEDSSGNDNTWTPTNLSGTADVMIDTPTNNFATLNALTPVVTHTISEGNLKSTNSSGTHGGTTATINYPTSGKWYHEVRINAEDSSKGQGVGIGNQIYKSSTDWGNYTNLIAYLSDGTKYIDTGYSSYGVAHNAGDIIGVAYNADDQELTFYHNNSSQGTIPTSEMDGQLDFNNLCPVVFGRNMGQTFNFGQDSSFAGATTRQNNTDGNGEGDFYYTPPSGYLTLNTSNLTTVLSPTINDGSAYFQSTPYTGNGSDGYAITNSGYSDLQPDFVWIKKRSSTSQHVLTDSSRGVTKQLFSSTNQSEQTSTEFLTSFNSDGFTTNNNSIVTDTGDTNITNGGLYVAWQWKANAGSTSSNTDGSITSTVQANTTAGFSIVTYTGTGSNATIGHGLGVAPKMIICKQRNNTAAHDWIVYHESIGNTDVLQLNQNYAKGTYSVVWNNTSPTSSVFSVGTAGSVNESGKNQLAYCFAEIEGYSKFGSYTGNGSTDGTFVYTGFRPAFVICKRTNGIGSWVVQDNKRPTYNQGGNYVYANASNTEATDLPIDILSNGFKQRQGAYSDNNGNGDTYIYMAFAEAPFKSGTGATTIEGTAR